MTVPQEVVAPNTVVRRGDVLWRATLDAVLLRSPGADEVVKLAGTGLQVWAALEEPQRFDHLCEELAASHDASVAQIAADLAPIVLDLVERSVMQVDPS